MTKNKYVTVINFCDFFFITTTWSKVKNIRDKFQIQENDWICVKVTPLGNVLYLTLYTDVIIYWHTFRFWRPINPFLTFSWQLTPFTSYHTYVSCARNFAINTVFLALLTFFFCMCIAYLRFICGLIKIRNKNRKKKLLSTNRCMQYSIVRHSKKYSCINTKNHF